ncbi:MAG: DUF4249 family protein [Melioribacteraceae bacterium]|nr:DUF4249 family protein [Melioribacteraceae bacterium]
MKIINRIIVAVLLLLNLSCEETLSPKGKLDDQYVLNCQIAFSKYWDSPSTVTAYLTRVYDVEGLDPEVQTEIPNYTGKVKLIYDNSEYSLTRTYKKNYDPDVKLPKSKFYINKILRQNTTVKIKAELPNGKILTAQTKLPQYKNFEQNYPFNSGLTTLIDSSVNFMRGRKFEISWKSQLGHSYLGKLNIVYTYTDDEGNKSMKLKEIPLEYIKTGGKEIAVYPAVDDYSSCVYQFKAIEKALTELSEGDPNKERYKIHNLAFSLLEYDSNLSLYYSSTESSADKYSIRTNKSVYSNVEGGYGIFGSQIVYDYYVKIHYFYVKSFGYEPPDA